ncbi:sensor histidine kinase [Roseivirga sp.]|uniref:sensor histidine kinase n=1 Tax=Roseivirga sp. TaxID=1964215 RepID=UPI003B8C1C08
MKFNWKLIATNLLFWVLYVVIWSIRDMAYAPTFWDTVDANVIGGFIYGIGVYINLYIFVPKLLLKGKRLLYGLVMSVWLLLVAYLGAKLFVYLYKDVSPSTSEFFDSAGGLASTAVEFMVVYALAMSLYFINEWYIKERKLRALESQNLKAELSLLKGQINPHFLFNALNSVHVLIRTNPELASNTLEKFSDLLSHQLYEVDKDEITLTQEVQNLDNFIQLQKIRHQDHVEVNWHYSGDLNSKSIAPMLFLNFVENAFKHGESLTDGLVKIEITIKVEGSRLMFNCKNSALVEVELKENSGLGIENIKRRLNLIYPHKHELEIDSTNNTYSVHLALDLNED